MSFSGLEGEGMGTGDAMELVKTCGVGCDARTIGNGDQCADEDTTFAGRIRAGCGAGGGRTVMKYVAAKESRIPPPFLWDRLEQVSLTLRRANRSTKSFILALKDCEGTL